MARSDAIETPGVRSCALIPTRLALIGPIVRLQVQRSSLKLGERPQRWFEPGPIMRVMALRVDGDGVTGIGANGDVVVDVHNRTHPQTKYRGENGGVSVGFTAHYATLRERFGDGLKDGIAGENILVESANVLSEDDLAGGLVIATDSGEIALEQVIVAAPCVEFAKFAAGYTPEDKADRAITDAVDFLHRGMRGFYATIATSSTRPAVIRPGDLVYRRLMA